jgi:hypothetical protein
MLVRGVSGFDDSRISVTFPRYQCNGISSGRGSRVKEEKEDVFSTKEFRGYLYKLGSGSAPRLLD